MWSQFHTENPKIWGPTVQNLVTPLTRRPGFVVYPYFQLRQRGTDWPSESGMRRQHCHHMCLVAHGNFYRCTVHSDIHTVHSPTDTHFLELWLKFTLKLDGSYMFRSSTIIRELAIEPGWSYIDIKTFSTVTSLFVMRWCGSMSCTCHTTA